MAARLHPRDLPIIAAPILSLLVLVWLAANPDQDRLIVIPNEHFLVVTLVSVIAVAVALLVVRTAVQSEQYQVLLVALGFMALAGFFSVHALATPGVFAPAPGYSPGSSSGYGQDYSSGYAAPASGHAAMVDFDYSGTVVGASGFLSVFVPSFFFAASYAPIALRLKRRLPVSAGGLVLAVVTFLLLYGVLAGWQTDVIAGLPVSKPPFSYFVVAVAVGLLGFAAWHHFDTYLRTRFPMQAALALAFVMLAQAQTLMVTSRSWSYSWWAYHVLMLIAVIAAIGALFLELDRRRGLERFLPAEVVERVVAGDQLRLGGDRRVVTILFADLRDSTALAEQLSAEGAVDMLNAYVGALGRCVFEHGGMIDKFLGDGLMAVFGIEPDPTDGALSAASTALSMRRAVAEVNRQRGADVGFRVGIHTGEVVLGSVGLPHRSDFTAIGDPVNTAARLEQLGKQYGVDNTISHDAVDRLPSNGFQLRELGTTPIRGKREPVQVYTLT